MVCVAVPTECSASTFSTVSVEDVTRVGLFFCERAVLLARLLLEYSWLIADLPNGLDYID